MPLKNYTTKISVEKTISQIEKNLAKHGASHIYKMYNDDGVPEAIAFKYTVNETQIAFKLPMEDSKVKDVFKKAVFKKEIPKRFLNDIDQARRTGWRIIKDWIDSQMALLEINLVSLDEIFLPYMYNEKLDKTMYEIMYDRNFNMPKLEGSEKYNEEYNSEDYKTRY